MTLFIYFAQRGQYQSPSSAPSSTYANLLQKLHTHIFTHEESNTHAIIEIYSQCDRKRLLYGMLHIYIYIDIARVREIKGDGNTGRAT